MKSKYTVHWFFTAAMLMSGAEAQPYHSDMVVGGVQTLEVDGDLSVKQYGAGLGGDLKVTGDAHFAAGGVTLPGMPSGVSGTYYGTQKLGNFTNMGEYVFEKTGDGQSGDFIVPLGRFGDWEGTTIQLDVQTGPGDSDSGGAHFTLMSKRHRHDGELTAVSHRAYGGGKRVKIHGFNTHGVTHLYLEFDGESNAATLHRVIVRAMTIGSISADNRDPGTEFANMTPVRLADSMVSDDISGNSVTHSVNAGNILLNGNVSVPAGKNLTINGAGVLTEASPPYSNATWNAVFVPRGNVTNGAVLALGESSASGINSISNGSVGAQATGAYSFASGMNAVSSGIASSANGFGANAYGAFSRAHGFGATAEGAHSTSYGYHAKALGNYSTAIGHYVEANSFTETAFGIANLIGPLDADTWDPNSYLFHIGNGSGPSERSDALTVLKNGLTTLTNKDWKLEQESPGNELIDPPATTDSDGEALVVEGHTRLKGKVIIDVPQGDISMGIYGDRVPSGDVPINSPEPNPPVIPPTEPGTDL